MISFDKIKVAVIASFSNSIAIWNCMKQHIDLMCAAGADITIFVSREESIELIQDEYQKRLITFMNKKELKAKVIQRMIDVIWYPTSIAMMHYGRLFKGCKVVLWVQGSVADESWMRNHSRLRVLILNLIESYVFHKADGLVYVSESMRSFYEKKYGHSFMNIAIVPCISDFHEYIPCSERIPESYVYIGGLSKWQCFDEIVDLYLTLRTTNSSFHIITMDTKQAGEIVKFKTNNTEDIRIYSVTDRTKIPDVLSTFQYGFLLRKNSPVNYVSSPIKFLEYLSCGVNVIMTDAVPSYAKLIKENNIGTIVSLGNLNDAKLNPFSSDARDVYLRCFSKDQFVEQYRNLLTTAIKAKKKNNR